MQMDAGLDTGAVINRSVIRITPDDTTGSLLEKLTSLGARLIVDTISALGGAAAVTTVQPVEGITYAAKIEKCEARIDWNEPAESIARRVRAFNPSPGAAARLNGVELKIWRARACQGDGAAGALIRCEPGDIRVACAGGALQLLELQRAGGRRLPAGEFTLGVAMWVGDRFEIRGPDSPPES